MIHGRTGVLAALFALAGLLGACSTHNTTTVTDVQSSESAAADYQDILVVAASRNADVRAAVGQALTRELNRHGASATFLADQNGTLPWGNPAELRSQLLDVVTKGRHDGVLVISLVDAKHHTRYQPETVTYIPDSRDIGPTASMTYMERSVQPESFERSVEYVIQSTLYDGTTGEAVWQLISSTVDPDSLDRAAKSFAAVVVDALEGNRKEARP